MHIRNHLMRIIGLRLEQLDFGVHVIQLRLNIVSGLVFLTVRVSPISRSILCIHARYLRPVLTSKTDRFLMLPLSFVYSEEIPSFYF